MFYDNSYTFNFNIELCTDASSAKGYGGYFQGKWFSSSWSNDIPSPRDNNVSMAFLKLYPIVVASLLWGSEWKCKKILFWYDTKPLIFVQFLTLISALVATNLYFSL
jgi:hypothetical protein